MDRKRFFLGSKLGRIPAWLLMRNIFTYLMLSTGVVIAIFPFFWMLSTSLMSLGEAQGTRLIPSAIHFENYVDIPELELEEITFI